MPEIHRRCLFALYKLCGREALVPKSLELPLCCNLDGPPLCRGEFTDVWKGSHDGKDTAVKVLRVGSSNGLEKAKMVSFQWWCLRLVFVTTADCHP
jgi:hypothetical protein